MSIICQRTQLACISFKLIVVWWNIATRSILSFLHWLIHQRSHPTKVICLFPWLVPYILCQPLKSPDLINFSPCLFPYISLKDSVSHQINSVNKDNNYVHSTKWHCVYQPWSFFPFQALLVPKSYPPVQKNINDKRHEFGLPKTQKYLVVNFNN